MRQGEYYTKVDQASRQTDQQQKIVAWALQVINEHEWASSFCRRRAIEWAFNIANTPPGNVMSSTDLLIDALEYEIHLDEEIKQAMKTRSELSS